MVASIVGGRTVKEKYSYIPNNTASRVKAKRLATKQGTAKTDKATVGVRGSVRDAPRNLPVIRRRANYPT